MNDKKRILIFLRLVLVAILLIWFIGGITSDGENSTLTYDQVVEEVRAGNVEKVSAVSGSLNIQMKMKDGSDKYSTIPSLDELSNLLLEEFDKGNQIEFEITAPRGGILSILPSLLMIGFYIGLFYMMSKRLSGLTGDEKDSFTKPVTSNVRFSDVAGIDEEKAQLVEVVEFLKNPNKYTSSGAKIPKGILLSGDPGTGKTLLAKAIAGEAGVPFFQANGSSFEEKFVGVGASRVRKLFNEAKKVAPCIIFIDEIDSVAQDRYSGRSYSEQTLNQLLAEMDGFETNENVIVIAATNHIEILDSAITRPGRFDRHVYVPKPDVIARRKILQLHARNKKLSEDVCLEDVAKRTTGFTGADLENILNEAAISSVNQGHSCISSEDIEEAIARVMVGLKKGESAITDEEKWLTAIHEAGHAIVSAVVRPQIKNFGISIVPRGSAGGYNIFDEADSMYLTRDSLRKQMQVLYGGRLAENIILGDISSGASNDIEKASKIAHLMITRFSMNGSLLSKVSGEPEFNKYLDNKSVKEAEKICQDNYDAAKEVVTKYEAIIIKLAEQLMEKEYFSQADVELFISENF